MITCTGELAREKFRKEIPYSKRLVEAYSKGKLLNFELL